ncbi:unnamed protein product [Chondrus crispus]|uniref:Uncharacterized protein n=1 Tax=Chondrus crispus TaxID=2769 RepID=R7Q4V1_CHOCR|nr:unnamed protein product [Chondrus crispus]CDF32898.1 unnamed protein product [Chondrus crispus]|eukprot:XP_005712699.1 unnamed protein product [Chondrus crispus]
MGRILRRSTQGREEERLRFEGRLVALERRLFGSCFGRAQERSRWHFEVWLFVGKSGRRDVRAVVFQGCAGSAERLLRRYGKVKHQLCFGRRKKSTGQQGFAISDDLSLLVYARLATFKTDEEHTRQ